MNGLFKIDTASLREGTAGVWGPMHWELIVCHTVNEDVLQAAHYNQFKYPSEDLAIFLDKLSVFDIELICQDQMISRKHPSTTRIPRK